MTLTGGQRRNCSDRGDHCLAQARAGLGSQLNRQPIEVEAGVGAEEARYLKEVLAVSGSVNSGASALLARDLSTTPGARTHIHRRAKKTGEVTLIRKTTRECDLGQRHGGIAQQDASELNAALQQITVRWHADRLPEGAREMSHRQAAFERQAAQWTLTAEI